MAKEVKDIQINNNKMRCAQCGNEKYIKTDFYKSKDPRFGVSQGKCYWCKECLEKMCFDDNGVPSRNKFREVLRDYLNLPFDQKIYEDSIKKDKRILGFYITQLNTRSGYKGKDLTWEDGQVNDDIDNESVYKEDKKVHSVEWMGYYSQVDLDYLNDYLEKLRNDFNIITTNHLDYAKKIAKASLATDKAYEEMLQGNKDADKRYKDLQSIFDNLSKSAQFSENSRGANDAGITGISQVVDKIENKQWIYEIEDFPEDELDHLLKQFSNIKKSL